jgi:hypothetical protein
MRAEIGGALVCRRLSESTNVDGSGDIAALTRAPDCHALWLEPRDDDAKTARIAKKTNIKVVRISFAIFAVLAVLAR